MRFLIKRLLLAQQACLFQFALGAHQGGRCGVLFRRQGFLQPGNCQLFGSDPGPLDILQLGRQLGFFQRQRANRCLQRDLAFDRGQFGLLGIVLLSRSMGRLLRQRGALLRQFGRTALFLQLQQRRIVGCLLGPLARLALLQRQRLLRNPGARKNLGLLLGRDARLRDRLQLAVDVDARLRRGQDARVGIAPCLRAGHGRRLDALTLDRAIAQFFFGLQTQVQRLGRTPLGLGVRQRDRFALLFDVGQRPGFFQRTRLRCRAAECASERDLIGALALQHQFQRIAFGIGQKLCGLARAVRMALALARQHHHARIGGRDAHHFFLGGVHGGQSFARLAPRLFVVRRQFLRRQHRLLGQSGFLRDIVDGQFARHFFALGTLLQGHADLGIEQCAGAQFGRFLLDGFEPGHAGIGGSAHAVEALAAGRDDFFRRLCMLQRGGGGGGIDCGAIVGQRAGARFRQRPRFGRTARLGLGLDARDAGMDRLHFHLGTAEIGTAEIGTAEIGAASIGAVRLQRFQPGAIIG